MPAAGSSCRAQGAAVLSQPGLARSHLHLAPLQRSSSILHGSTDTGTQQDYSGKRHIRKWQTVQYNMAHDYSRLHRSGLATPASVVEPAFRGETIVRHRGLPQLTDGIPPAAGAWPQARSPRLRPRSAAAACPVRTPQQPPAALPVRRPISARRPARQGEITFISTGWDEPVLRAAFPSGESGLFPVSCLQMCLPAC